MRALIKCVIFILLSHCCIESSMAGIITGILRNIETGEPIPAVTVRVEGTAHAMFANEVGQYRLVLIPGSYRLKFSHIAFHSEYRDILVSDSEITLNIAMQETLIQLPGITVYDQPYDPAQEIIMKAIAHKQKILQQLQNYSFEAYVREVAYNQNNNDTGIIDGILETQLDCFWAQPDKYKEIIVTRRQTSNIKADQNIMHIEGIPNFNMDRIRFEQYSIVSPTAKDALKYYNYYLIDTIFFDNQLIYRLEVDPKNETDPLVVGTIDIVDSTFNIVGVEGSFNEGIYIPFLKNFHYSQRFDEFKNKFWMPTEIHMDYTLNLIFPIEKILAINFVAALYNYNFDCTLPKGTFDYALEISEKADVIDSQTWNNRQAIPLTPAEKNGYLRIDSLVNTQKSLYRKALSGTQFILKSSFNYDMFHFNKVEGAYLGLSHYWWGPTSRTEMEMKLGYAFSRKYWQQCIGLYYRFWNRRRSYVGIYYRNEIKHSPVITAPYYYNPALWNLFAKIDPFDYYLEKGFQVFITSELNKKTKVAFSYRDFSQSSEINNTNYSIFQKDKQYRINPGIEDGKLRSIYLELLYDSRQRLRVKGREAYFLSKLLTLYEFGVEVATPNLIENDYDFVLYHSRLKYIGHTFLHGLTTFEIYFGWTDNILPPQRYFTVDYSYKILNDGMSFKTLGDKNFTGNNVVALYLSQNFGRWCFRKSRLPVIKKIPFSFSLNGGIFWIDFKKQYFQPDNPFLNTAPKPYIELGFSLGRIPPLSNRLDFTWQLSDYKTNHFNFSFGLER